MFHYITVDRHFLLTIKWHGFKWTIWVEAGSGQHQGVLAVVMALDPNEEYQEVNSH